jgi:hypothetical protein
MAALLVLGVLMASALSCEDTAVIPTMAPTASPRVISLSGNLAFGSVAVNTTATSLLIISNLGNSPLTVTSISYPTGFTGNWAGTVPGGGSQNVPVTFAPTSAIGYGGVVTVNADQATGTPTISISGTGTTPTPQDATIANGDYAGAGNTVSNGCGLNGEVTVTGTIDVNKAGQGTWTKRHVSAGGVVFKFNVQLQVVSAKSVTFTATTFANPYTITDTGTLADSRVLTVTQEFTRQDTPCKTVYNITLRKQ